MSVIHGTTAFAAAKISLVRDEYSTDPGTGPSRVIEWHGLKDTMIAKQQSLSDKKTRLSPLQGGLWSLVQTITGAEAAVENPDPNNEVAYDKWTIGTTVLEKEIWAHPMFFAAAYTHDPTYPHKFRVAVEAVSKEDANAPADSGGVFYGDHWLSAPYQSETVRSVALKALTELARGATNYEDEYLALRRTRTISTTYPLSMPTYHLKLIFDAGQIWMPTNVLFSLPPTTNDPAYAHWGWRLKSQSSDFLGPNKIEQAFEWVFAAWSTILYERSTFNFPQ